ncbi:MAG TPA: CDGSH iron-sulfur domain-containing protein [Actinobacteria bacterium]|nr:CDGSH iron-sulfur domain-containing protein [Actinomycetota bacterium]
MEIHASENGPYLIDTNGRVRLGDETKELRRLALCRCGASENKPTCDGSHKKIGFEAPEVTITID